MQIVDLQRTQVIIFRRFLKRAFREIWFILFHFLPSSSSPIPANNQTVPWHFCEIYVPLLKKLSNLNWDHFCRKLNNAHLQLSVFSISFFKQLFCSKFQDSCKFIFVERITPVKYNVIVCYWDTQLRGLVGQITVICGKCAIKIKMEKWALCGITFLKKELSEYD